jgi:bacterioferritin
MVQGAQEVIDILNEALTAELTAVNQYFAASKMAANAGYGKLAADLHEESLGEMKHAEALIDRILYLEGTPNMQRLFTVELRGSVVEQFRANHAMELGAVERYQRAVAICDDAGDPGTRVLMERFLVEEEAHVDEAEAELANLEQLGEQLWLAKWV